MTRKEFDTLVDTRDFLRTIQPTLSHEVALESNELITQLGKILEANRPHCLESEKHGAINTSGYCVDCGENGRGD